MMDQWISKFLKPLSEVFEKIFNSLGHTLVAIGVVSGMVLFSGVWFYWTDIAHKEKVNTAALALFLMPLPTAILSLGDLILKRFFRKPLIPSDYEMQLNRINDAEKNGTYTPEMAIQERRNLLQKSLDNANFGDYPKPKLE